MLDIYLSGKKLHGDDFSYEEIWDWYEDEKEGYADLGAKKKSSYKYAYHSLNAQHGYQYIGNRKYHNVLGLGSAYGDEFIPIIDKIKKLTIVDPSDAFITEEVHGVPCHYVKPSIDGLMPFDDADFDMIVCLGVLHHIPNVTTVVNELFRCLSNSGIVLLREPIVSLGDWSKPRPGLTKRERGIPLNIFKSIINDAGFVIKHQSLCVFSLIPKISNRIGISAYNSSILTWIDKKLCQLFSWNVNYHPTKLVHKFRPWSVYFVLNKQV